MTPAAFCRRLTSETADCANGRHPVYATNWETNGCSPNHGLVPSHFREMLCLPRQTFGRCRSRCELTLATPMKRRQNKLSAEAEASPKLVPAGAPAWITADLIADTIATWQPYYADPLTLEDALAILLSVGRFLDVLVLE